MRLRIAMIWFKPIDFGLGWGMGRVLSRVSHLTFHWVNHFGLTKPLVKTY